MRRELYPSSMALLRRKALANGASHKPPKRYHGDPPSSALSRLQYLEWDCSGSCSNPEHVECYSRPSRKGRGKVATDRIGVDILVRCRKCPECLKARAATWRYRALAEYRQAPRTWLVTLTFKPEFHLRALSIARHKVDRQGVNFDTLTDEEKARLISVEHIRAITLYFKRLRKDGAEYRYMLVAEEHKSGLPHYHCLLHELPGRPPIRHACLKRHWRDGFSDAKLVHDERAATYAAKYLSKSLLARVRASIGYGKL